MYPFSKSRSMTTIHNENEMINQTLQSLVANYGGKKGKDFRPKITIMVDKFRQP